jgi:hypothetical protein
MKRTEERSWREEDWDQNRMTVSLTSWTSITICWFYVIQNLKYWMVFILKSKEVYSTNTKTFWLHFFSLYDPWESGGPIAMRIFIIIILFFKGFSNYFFVKLFHFLEFFPALQFVDHRLWNLHLLEWNYVDFPNLVRKKAIRENIHS